MNAHVGVATGCDIVRKHVATGLKLPPPHLHSSEYILNKEQPWKKNNVSELLQVIQSMVEGIFFSLTTASVSAQLEMLQHRRQARTCWCYAIIKSKNLVN